MSIGLPFTFGFCANPRIPDEISRLLKESEVGLDFLEEVIAITVFCIALDSTTKNHHHCHCHDLLVVVKGPTSSRAKHKFSGVHHCYTC